MVLFLIFLYSFFWCIILPVFFPLTSISYFAPFLIFYLTRMTKQQSLWTAFFCGLIIDLFCVQTRLGIYALNYTVVVFCLFSLKNYFFEDGLARFPFLALIFTILSSLVEAILLFIFHPNFQVHLLFLTKALFQKPFFDLSYLLLTFFFLPFIFPSFQKKTPAVIKFHQKGSR